MNKQDEADDLKARSLLALSGRNAEIFNLVVREQNKKIEDQDIKIKLLNNTLSAFSNRIDELERLLITYKVSTIGTGPTVR